MAPPRASRPHFRSIPRAAGRKSEFSFCLRSGGHFKRELFWGNMRLRAQKIPPGFKCPVATPQFRFPNHEIFSPPVLRRDRRTPFSRQRKSRVGEKTFAFNCYFSLILVRP